MTLFGITILSILFKLEKALAAIVVTALPMCKFTIFEQLANAELSIVSTSSGITRLVNVISPLKADELIVTSFSGNETSFNFSQL